MNKIAIIDHVGNKAGMDYYSELLALGFKNNSVHPIVISNFVTQEKGIKFHPIFIGHTNSRVKKGINHFLAFICAAIICKKVNCKTVIVHSFSYGIKDYYAFLILKLFKLKIITILHDIENLAQPNSSFLQRIIIRRFADRIMVHNNFSFSVLMKSFGNLARSKSKIIPHGNFHKLVPFNISRNDARLKLNLKNNITYLLFFGQIKDVKGLSVLLKAMSNLPNNIHLIIAGKPWKSGFEQYQELIENLGIQDRIITHIRFIEDQLRDNLFLAADLLILPYKKIFQSGVLLMGMSYKIPMVVSDLDPMKELIKNNETGFLFSEGNEASLSDTILKALASHSNLSEVKENAWMFAKQNFNWNVIAKEIINWE